MVEPARPVAGLTIFDEWGQAVHDRVYGGGIQTVAAPWAAIDIPVANQYVEALRATVNPEFVGQRFLAIVAAALYATVAGNISLRLNLGNETKYANADAYNGGVNPKANLSVVGAYKAPSLNAIDFVVYVSHNVAGADVTPSGSGNFSLQVVPL